MQNTSSGKLIWTNQNSIQILITMNDDKRMWDGGTTGLEFGMCMHFSFINKSVFCVSCKPAAKWLFSKMWVYEEFYGINQQ